jgi:hypothetical protein
MDRWNQSSVLFHLSNLVLIPLHAVQVSRAQRLILKRVLEQRHNYFLHLRVTILLICDYCRLALLQLGFEDFWPVELIRLRRTYSHLIFLTKFILI